MFWLFLSSILCEYIDNDNPNFEGINRFSLCFCIEETKDGCKNQFEKSHPSGCDKMYGPKWYNAFSDTQNRSTVKLYVPNGYDYNGTIVLNKYAHGSTIYLPTANRFSVNFNNQYHLTIRFVNSSDTTKHASNVTPLGSGVINATFPDVSKDMWASGEGKALRDGPILDVKNSGFSGKYPVCDWSSFYCVILHENVNYILKKAPRILNLTDATEITLNDPGFTCTFTNTSIDIALNETSPKIQITKNIFSTPRIINLKEDTFKKNYPDILSPTFIITNDNCLAEPLNVKSEAALLTIDFYGSLNWVVTVKSDDWAPYRFVDFLLGSKYISGAKPVETHFTGSLSLFMETGKPIVGINSFNDDMHVYLNHSDVVLASVVKMSYKDINIESLNFHIVPLTSNATNLYVSNSYKVNYYVDNKEPTVNVYISESYLDNFFTSNAKYIVQNKIVFPETYHDSSEKKSYQYGVFARGSTDDEAIGVNEFVNNINNLEILNGSYIDLESYEKLNWKLPLYLNENITFSGSKYYIATNIHREGISFDNYPKESKLADTEMPDSKRFYVMCQPNLDCNKFVISPKSDKYYINSDDYWQQEGAITTVCDKYSTIWPKRERVTENNPCCKEFLASNEATDSMTCVGYRIDKKLETEYKVKYIARYPEQGSLFTEDGFIQ
ncbi:hypothetical protein TRFO_13789 [Tritrichomonas foetus]|uniref:IgGFc-binding protein N-terminal domain-containing protein n=1 Tax=Tritrichomonas foetus TaxID=1144522 RepID=A0A1J4KX27_9EUKA|nr:hypothetical protein TRFO_13789 [Tritrichomonas foetus]|eukprot:OHT15791.1 hypothetical protein TRFO_13789 [Tritrichomonas foetus]